MDVRSRDSGNKIRDIRITSPGGDIMGYIKSQDRIGLDRIR